MSAGPARSREPAAVTSSVDTTPGETLSSQFRTAGYMVLVLAALFPLLDLLSGLYPTNFGNATWRFGAVGLFSNFAMGLSLELFLIAVIALVANQRRVLLVLGVLSALLAVLLLGSAVLFVLDALQTRARVNPAVLHRFDFAAGGAVAKLLLYAVANLVLARGAFAAARRRTSRPTSPRSRGMVTPVVPARPVDSGAVVVEKPVV
jgi:hypothetical protein